MSVPFSARRRGHDHLRRGMGQLRGHPSLLTTLINGGNRFQATCPVCGYFVTVTRLDDGEALIECSNDECRTDDIGARIDSLKKQEANGRRAARAAPGRRAAAGLGGERVVRVWGPDARVPSPPLTVEAFCVGSAELDALDGRHAQAERDLAFPALAIGFGPDKPLAQSQAQVVYRALVGACETLEVSDTIRPANGWSSSWGSSRRSSSRPTPRTRRRS